MILRHKRLILTGRACATMVQRPPPLPAGALRNRLKQRRNGGHSGQRGCTGIARLRGIGRANRKISLFGHVSRRFACGFNFARTLLQHPVHISRCGDECIDDGYRARINQLLTNSRTPLELAGLSGTDLAPTLPKNTAKDTAKNTAKDTGTPCQEP